MGEEEHDERGPDSEAADRVANFMAARRSGARLISTAGSQDVACAVRTEAGEEYLWRADVEILLDAYQQYEDLVLRPAAVLSRVSAGDDDPPPQVGEQVAWRAIVYVLVPPADLYGRAVGTPTDASDYLSNELGEGNLLDWGYVARPTPVTVSDPYVEGSAFG